jgi:hypothetical protein
MSGKQHHSNDPSVDKSDRTVPRNLRQTGDAGIDFVISTRVITWDATDIELLIDDPVEDVPYYGLLEATINDVPVLVSQTGFSGEAGFEIYPLGRDVVTRLETISAGSGRDTGVLGAHGVIESRLSGYVREATTNTEIHTRDDMEE